MPITNSKLPVYLRLAVALPYLIASSDSNSSTPDPSQISSDEQLSDNANVVLFYTIINRMNRHWGMHYINSQMEQLFRLIRPYVNAQSIQSLVKKIRVSLHVNTVLPWTTWITEVHLNVRHKGDQNPILQQFFFKGLPTAVEQFLT